MQSGMAHHDMTARVDDVCGAGIPMYPDDFMHLPPGHPHHHPHMPHAFHPPDDGDDGSEDDLDDLDEDEDEMQWAEVCLLRYDRSITSLRWLIIDAKGQPAPPFCCRIGSVTIVH
jgi:hypothetical protein